MPLIIHLYIKPYFPLFYLYLFPFKPYFPFSFVLVGISSDWKGIPTPF